MNLGTKAQQHRRWPGQRRHDRDGMKHATLIGAVVGLLAACSAFGPPSWSAEPGVNSAGLAHWSDGRTSPARLTAIDSDWRVRFADGTQPSADELVYWGTLAENHRSPLVLLTDGSSLATDLLEIDELQARIGAPPQSFGPPTLWHDIRLPRERLRGTIVRQWPSPRRQYRLLDAVLEPSNTSAGDTFWLDNGDRVAGQLRRAVFAGRDPQIALQTASGEVTLPYDRLQAVALKGSRPPPAAQPPAGVLGFRDSSRLHVRRIEATGPSVRLVLAEDLVIEVDDVGSFWREVCYVRPPNPRVTYVSQLSALGYRHIPYLSVVWPHGTDRNVLGQRLRASGALYERGLGMHSTSRLAYEVPAGTRRFQAELAIDDSAAGKGSVVFRVYGQPEDADWQPLFESQVIRGGDAPSSIDLDLAGSQRIALIVDFADRGDEMDRADWLMARFLK
jgi:hypothetical protein